jgi:hypothetical protein
MTSPIVTAVLCVIGGLGLMALVIAEGQTGLDRDDRLDRPDPAMSSQHDRDHAGSGVTVWELRRREQPDALLCYRHPFDDHAASTASTQDSLAMQLSPPGATDRRRGAWWSP